MYDFNFFNSTNVQTLWELIGMLLKGVAPGVMISVAFPAVGLLIYIVSRAFHEANKKEKEEDYEYKEY